MIATVVLLGSTVALGEGAPLLIFGPLALLAGVVVGWRLDRRYLPVFVLVVCVTIMFTGLFHTRADASPTPQQPATHRLTEPVAHRSAVIALDKVIKQWLPGPRSSHVDRCYGGPRVWRCPSTLTGGDTSCTLTMWVWSDGQTIWGEMHRLRCS